MQNITCIFYYKVDIENSLAELFSTTWVEGLKDKADLETLDCVATTLDTVKPGNKVLMDVSHYEYSGESPVLAGLELLEYVEERFKELVANGSLSLIKSYSSRVEIVNV
ncbi:hypothetical protein D3C71_1225170 [compost metagenome]